MAVDHAQRARWASRVLRLRQAGLGLGLDDVQSTAGAVEKSNPETAALERELGVGEVDQHVIGASGHPLTALVASFADLEGDDNYVIKLFDMDIDALVEESRKETGAAHEQMVSHVDQLKPGTIAMSQGDVDDCYSSQDEDELAYLDGVEEMQGTGAWPDAHRLGHGHAMQQEVNNG